MTRCAISSTHSTNNRLHASCCRGHLQAPLFAVTEMRVHITPYIARSRHEPKRSSTSTLRTSRLQLRTYCRRSLLQRILPKADGVPAIHTARSLPLRASRLSRRSCIIKIPICERALTGRSVCKTAHPHECPSIHRRAQRWMYVRECALHYYGTAPSRRRVSLLQLPKTAWFADQRIRRFRHGQSHRSRQPRPSPIAYRQAFGM